MKRRRFTYAFSQGVALWYQILFLGHRAIGLGNVPLDGACILAANHKSYLDPPAIAGCLRREVRYFAKRELFKVPILGPMIRNYGAIPVDREAFDRKTYRKAIDLLAAGEALLVFPEGTRIRRPGFGPPKEGVGMIAAQAGVPVIPVWVGHTYEPRRTLFRRIPVEVRFGEPIDFTSEPAPADRRERYSEITRRIMAEIAHLGGEAPPVDAEDAPEGEAAPHSAEPHSNPDHTASR